MRPAGPDCAGLQGQQVAALCWRLRAGAVEVLLVTSRDTGRWLIPKGWLMPGRTPADAAAREAWEEAGVTGRIRPDPLGRFAYVKTRADAPDLPCTVMVFALAARRVARDWPEREARTRLWLPAAAAAARVAEPGLAALIAAFPARAAGAPP